MAAFVLALVAGAAVACGSLLGDDDDVDTVPDGRDGTGDASAMTTLDGMQTDTTTPVGDIDGGLDSGADGATDGGADAPFDGGIGCRGDAGCERYVFVSSQQYLATALGQTDADAFCNQLKGNSPKIANRHFLAWISENGKPASARFAATAPIRRLDDVQVAASLAALLTSGASAPVTVTESGNALGTLDLEYVWTGTQNDGNPNQPCGGEWNDAMAQGKRGSAKKTGTAWTDDGAMVCSLMARIYCFEY